MTKPELLAIEAVKLANSIKIQKRIDQLYAELERMDAKRARVEDCANELEDVLEERRAKEENDYWIKSKFPASFNKRG